MSNMDVKAKVDALTRNIETAIRGKPEAVRLAVVALLARGHLLIEDVPGIGKTTLAHALARSINCPFQRIQFTSDMLPSDVTGVSVFNKTTQSFEFRQGPVFTNIVLADEINRATPKTQSALLEAMNEGQVTVDKLTHRLPEPFMVIATQNPLEFHGTFPLPESQMDRFIMRLRLGYPDREHERQILEANVYDSAVMAVNPVLEAREVLELQREIERVRFGGELTDYLLSIVEATRSDRNLALGASPRGSLYLGRAARAAALADGRDYCIPDDIKTLAPAVLAHRVIVESRAGGFGKRAEDAEDVIRDIVDAVEVPV
jgi:MoxR-like ATPase